ncbi:MAG TPA: hypothetical protein DEP35_10540 [Deltaproteobacteria bacterium]|jgi:hypothetical protein|nr:hypothetical protein [Deltaproteobacteria bacterium]
MKRTASATTRLGFVCLLAGAASLHGACEPVRHYNRLQVASFEQGLPRRPYGSVKVFRDASDIGRPYEAIGMMSCEGSAGDEAGILNAMLYRAADMGADGVLLNDVPRIPREQVGGSVDFRYGWAALIGNGDQRAYRAEAIRFKE